MNNSFKDRIRIFFQNRNGIDELALVSFFLSLLFSLLALFFKNFVLIILYIIELLFFAYFLFRVLSKNIYARSKENNAFCSFFKNIFKKKTKYKKQKTIKVKKVKEKKQKKDKNYIYKKCPYCNSELKILKKYKGQRTVMCTKCYNEIVFKI